MQLDQSLSGKCVDLLVATADRFEKVCDCFTLPASLLVQREFEKTDQVEVVLLEEAFLDLSQAHALNLCEAA